MAFELHIPTNLAFRDFLAITQTARAWADAYDLKSSTRLTSILATTVTIDYTEVNPTWGRKTYEKEEFAKLWLSEEHLGNPALWTQHLLGAPYFSYVGVRRSSVVGSSQPSQESTLEHVSEIEVSWQTLASHGRYNDTAAVATKQVAQISDHRAFMLQVYVKEYEHSAGAWKLASIKPQLDYMVGDFETVRKTFDAASN